MKLTDDHSDDDNGINEIVLGSSGDKIWKILKFLILFVFKTVDYCVPFKG